MKTWLSLTIVSILTLVNLSACGPSQSELDSTATQASRNDAGTQTAAAPTATSTFTPSPTATLAPTPTSTPEPTSTPTPMPTPQGTLEEITWTYELFLMLDGASERITATTDLLDQGKIDQNQANNHIQLLNHGVRTVEAYSQMYESTYKETDQAVKDLLEACQRWWSGESDAQTLGQEVSTIRDNFQPKLILLRDYLLTQPDVSQFSEKDLDDQFDELIEMSDQVMEYDGSSDMFQMQRYHSAGLFGGSSTLGAFDYEKGYTSPDGTFTCSFVFQGYGELLYDFIFPDRTMVVLTNDSGLGQAVERYPLDEQVENSEAAQILVNKYFEQKILPALTEQHANLRILDEEWINLPGDSSQEALQEIIVFPQASYVYEITDAGKKYGDVVRGLWIYTLGNGIYVVTYQQDVGTDPMTDAKLVKTTVAGLQDFQQACNMK